MSIAIAAATMSLGSCQQAQRENPLLQESTLPFGAPDFSKIDSTDYMPAFEAAIQQTRDEIKQIVDNPDSATFENTILAYEESGKLLDRVGRVFFALVEADKTPALADIEKKVQPMLTDLENEISFNKALFERIKKVYDTQYESLQGEDKKLLEETYKEFVRKGALLPDDKMARMKEINLRISELQTKWGEVLPNATNDAVVWVDKKEDLAGMSEADIAQCAKDAESRGGKAPYAIVIVNTNSSSPSPALTTVSCARRSMRPLSIVLTVRASTTPSTLSVRLPVCVLNRLRLWVIPTTPPIPWRRRWPRTPIMSTLS